MNTDKQLSPNFSIIPQTNLTGMALDLTPGEIGSLIRTMQVTQLALHQLTAFEIYSFQHLVAEMQRQSELLMKGGGSPEQQRQIDALLLACTAELRTVSRQLNAQLLAIVNR